MKADRLLRADRFCRVSAREGMARLSAGLLACVAARTRTAESRRRAGRRSSATGRFASLLAVCLMAGIGFGAFGSADAPWGCWAGPRQAIAALDDTLEAVCRISAPDGSRGTGCAFEHSGGRVYVLTAAHVVGAFDAVWCEFWRQGRPGARLPGRVAAVDRGADAAILAVDEACFSEGLPRIIAPARPDAPPPPGAAITSAGCAAGGWPTAFKGVVVDLLPGELCFIPPPANGRSGSPLLDAEGRAILGVIRARTADNATGIATPIARVFHAFSARGGDTSPPLPREAKWGMQGPEPRTDGGRVCCSLPPNDDGRRRARGIDWFVGLCGAEATQCPGDTCPGSSLVPFGRATPPREAVPLPEVFGARRPSLPPGPAPVVPAPRQPLNPPPASPNGDPPGGGQPSAAPSGGEAQRGDSSDDRALLAQELLRLLLGDADTLLDRAAARAARLRQQLGDDASAAEIARLYARDAAAEKLADGRFGWTAGKLLAAALGLSGPLSLALAGGLWLASRRVARRIEQSEPLVVERLWRRISQRMGERPDDRLGGTKEEPGGERFGAGESSSAEARHAAG